MSKVHIVFGPQGDGKSTYSKKLATQTQGVHLAIDDWMWKLYGDDLPASMNLKWIMERVERCEKQIWSLTKNISDCGVDVILDLGFTKRARRKHFQQLIAAHKKDCHLHYVTAEHTLRRQRVLFSETEFIRCKEGYGFETLATCPLSESVFKLLLS